MVTGLSQVFLLVSDLSRSIHFYRQLLEPTPVSEDASMHD
jgi:catechol 2,3-dioxygenase-like lactoylglutathione lyase family enzyme